MRYFLGTNLLTMRTICLSALLLLASLAANAAESTLDSIRHALETNTNAVVQEKVFLHMDNTCYFVGDTLWYKAYVVRPTTCNRPT